MPVLNYQFNITAKRFNELFRKDSLDFKDYVDFGLSNKTGFVEFDLVKLDAKLHEIVGNYERDSHRSMKQVIIQRYGTDAARFIEDII